MNNLLLRQPEEGRQGKKFSRAIPKWWWAISLGLAQAWEWPTSMMNVSFQEISGYLLEQEGELVLCHWRVSWGDWVSTTWSCLFTVCIGSMIMCSQANRQACCQHIDAHALRCTSPCGHTCLHACMRMWVQKHTWLVVGHVSVCEKSK